MGAQDGTGRLPNGRGMLDPETAPGTYSILAVDAARGDVGCAVQSRYFHVGPVVPWVRPGVGAVATQSNANMTYGPRGLDRLEAGEAPEGILAALTAADELREQRQAAVLNMRGESARWTGSEVNPWHGTAHGPGYSCQGNLLAGPEMIQAMAAAFEASAGEELGERLLRALEAAEAAGGDARGSQSAALKVCRWDGRGEPPVWSLFDLRVDEHRDPIGELRRLFELKRAYRLAHQAREHMGTGNTHAAREAMERALAIAPEDDYLRAIAAEACYRAGDRSAALGHFRRAIALNSKAACYLTLFGADTLYDASFRGEVL